MFLELIQYNDCFSLEAHLMGRLPSSCSPSVRAIRLTLSWGTARLAAKSSMKPGQKFVEEFWLGGSRACWVSFFSGLNLVCRGRLGTFTCIFQVAGLRDHGSPMVWQSITLENQPNRPSDQAMARWFIAGSCFHWNNCRCMYHFGNGLVAIKPPTS